MRFNDKHKWFKYELVAKNEMQRQRWIGIISECMRPPVQERVNLSGAKFPWGCKFVDSVSVVANMQCDLC